MGLVARPFKRKLLSFAFRSKIASEDAHTPSWIREPTNKNRYQYGDSQLSVALKNLQYGTGLWHCPVSGPLLEQGGVGTASCQFVELN